MSVATCRHCEQTIMIPPSETYYFHTRTGMAQCGIRYATPIDPTPDESAWTEFDLQAFWEGLNGIEPIGAMSELESGGEVDKTTTDQISCDTELTKSECNPTFHDPTRLQSYRYCPMCGKKL